MCISVLSKSYTASGSSRRVPLEKLIVTQLVKFPILLWNPKALYRVHKSPSLLPIRSKMNPVHIFLPYFPKIHSSVIVPSTLMSSEWSLPFRISEQNFVCLPACYMSRPSNPSLLDHRDNIW